MRTLKTKHQNDNTPLTHPEAQILLIAAHLTQGNISLTVKRIANALHRPYSNQFIAATVKEITGQEIS